MKDCRLEGLIMRASIIPNMDYKEISRIMAEDNDSCKCKIEIYKDLYKYIFQGHLQTDECEEWISNMPNTIWSIDETNMVAKKLDYDFAKKSYTKDEFRLAMHLVYCNNYYPLKESNVTLDSTTYGRLADYYLDNIGKCKLVDDFFNTMCTE